MGTPWRAVAALAGAAVLAASVVLLRGQVPPRTVAEPPPTAPQPLAQADPGLQVQDPERPPRWRLFTPPQGAVDGLVGPQHVVYTRTAGDTLELTVQQRDTGRTLLQHTVATDAAPWSSLLHDGRLMVAFGREQVRLIALDPATGEARELTAPAGYTFRPRLVDLGEEVLVLAWYQQPRQSCVLAAQPATGAVRVVWCSEQGMSPAWLYDGVNEAAWPATIGLPNGCPTWQRLRPGGQVEPVDAKAPLCGARGLVELDGWQITQRSRQESLTPMVVATDGQRQLALGGASAYVACGRRLYWTATTRGVEPDTVYRWLPGTNYREIAYRLESTGRLMLGTPRCTDGVLNITVVPRHDPRILELRSLSRP